VIPENQQTNNGSKETCDSDVLEAFPETEKTNEEMEESCDNDIIEVIPENQQTNNGREETCDIDVLESIPESEKADEDVVIEEVIEDEDGEGSVCIVSDNDSNFSNGDDDDCSLASLKGEKEWLMADKYKVSNIDEIEIIDVEEKTKDDIIIEASSSLHSTKSKLRFLSGMVVRVKDDSTVQKVAGKTCRILGILRLGIEEELATVSVVGESAGNGTVKVPVTDLDPGLPEEGDLVTSLYSEDGKKVGHLVSLEDDDTALVKFPGEKELRCVLVERLCVFLRD